MASPPSETTVQSLNRLADELQRVRERLDSMSQRLDALTQENAMLREQLQQSEAARNELLAQAEHIVELLASSRREVRELRAKGDAGQAP